MKRQTNKHKFLYVVNLCVFDNESIKAVIKNFSRIENISHNREYAIT
jgi:hypothetical protein